LTRGIALTTVYALTCYTVIRTRKLMLSYVAKVTTHVEVKHLGGLQALSGGREVTGNKHVGYARPLRLRLQRLSIHPRPVRRRYLTGQETHQEMGYPNLTSLFFATPLAFNAPDGGVPRGRSL